MTLGREHRYGPAAHQVYETFGTPRLGPGAPLVVLVHGGFWRAEWDRSHLRPLAAALAERGYAVALVEYSRSGMPTGGWPATGHDCRSALAAARREHARRPVLLLGHSAGGHLALWLLHQPEADGVAGAVSLAGCLDLHLVADLDLDDGAARDLLGCAPADAPDAWAAADPARLGRTAYPVVAVHGTADEKVPLAVTESWWEAAGDLERDRLIVLEGASHFPLIDPEAPEHETVLAALAHLHPAR